MLALIPFENPLPLEMLPVGGAAAEAAAGLPPVWTEAGRKPLDPLADLMAVAFLGSPLEPFSRGFFPVGRGPGKLHPGFLGIFLSRQLLPWSPAVPRYLPASCVEGLPSFVIRTDAPSHLWELML